MQLTNKKFEMRGFKMEIKMFSEYLTGITQSKFTISSILSDIRIFFRSYNRLNTENVQKFVQEQSKSGMDAKTVIRRVSSLRRYAKFRKIIIGELELPRTRRNINKIQIISESDLIKIRNYIDKINKGDGLEMMRLKIILLLLNMGLRRSEITNLSVSDLDFDNERIKLTGKGEKSAIAPLYGRTTDFKDYIEIRSDLEPVDGFLIVHKYLGVYKQIYHREFYKILYDFTESLFGRRINPHAFRHSLGCLMLDNTVDIRIIQEILRHESIATTTIYTQVSTARIKNEVVHSDCSQYP